MRRSTLGGCAAFAVVWLVGASVPAQVTMATLLAEAADLERLARLPDPPYRLVQFSSHDRRSTSPGAPGWFGNADGYPNAPKPGFAAVLREPGDDGVGEYLVCEVNGPGAILRGWSAAMPGVLRVWIDDREPPIFEGEARTFLARRTAHYLGIAKAADRALANFDPGDAFTQEDADYLPIPFAKKLRVTWTGTRRKPHFYHLGVRVYPDGTEVTGFDPVNDLRSNVSALRGASSRLSAPGMQRPSGMKSILRHTFDLEPGAETSMPLGEGNPAAIHLINVWVRRDGDMERVLRGTLLRIRFDGAEQPQVEAPLGDFFGAGPGVHPFESLAMTVTKGGAMRCRFMMPFAKGAEISLHNHAGQRVSGRLRVTLVPWEHDERTLEFRARWRVDHGIDSGGRPRPQDLRWLDIEGTGRLVGAACQLVNPTGIPTTAGGWWGDGDERIFVDGEQRPSISGTGTADYFNYAWSRPTLFAHPYSGQPLSSGPGNAGYVANFRHQVLDDVPFTSRLRFDMELSTHTPTKGMSVGRMVYCYARPGAKDDHRALTAEDLVVPPLPAREPQAAGGARGATFRHFLDMVPDGEARELAIASRGKVLQWSAAEGEVLKMTLPVEKAGTYGLHMVLLQTPEGLGFRVKVDGEPLALPHAGDSVGLKVATATQLRTVRFAPREFTAGEHEVAIECVHAGLFAGDYVWLKP